MAEQEKEAAGGDPEADAFLDKFAGPERYEGRFSAERWEQVRPGRRGKGSLRGIPGPGCGRGLTPPPSDASSRGEAGTFTWGIA